MVEFVSEWCQLGQDGANDLCCGPPAVLLPLATRLQGLEVCVWRTPPTQLGAPPTPTRANLAAVTCTKAFSGLRRGWLVAGASGTRLRRPLAFSHALVVWGLGVGA